jgi:urea transport system substrate-binding protein
MKSIRLHSANRPATRRGFLRQAATAGLTLAASTVPLKAATPKKGETIKVGIMQSLTGFMASAEKSLHDAELLAIEEINQAGGVLGKKIVPIVEDPASSFNTGFPAKAKKLVEEDKVAAVFGCYTSVSRKVVLNTFEKNNSLLFYAVAYEGTESSKNVIYSGAVPGQQVIPAVDYLWKEMKKRKFYLLGSDYVYPRTANYLIQRHLKAAYKTAPAREKYVSLTDKDFSAIVDDIKKQKPDAILLTLNGGSNIPFFTQLADAGIKPADIPVCSFLLGEDELSGLNMKVFQGHLAAWSYFQSIPSAGNKVFVEAFQDKYGKTRVTADAIEAAYFQVHLWKKAVEKAKTTATDNVRVALRELKLQAPGGTIKVDPKNNHVWKPFRLGKIQADGQFKILYSSKELLKPDPYPYRNRI